MSKSRILLAVTLAVGTTMAAFPALSQNAPEKKPNDWLLNAPDDTTRFTLLQKYLRGFDQPMWEVGERYKMIYDALGKNNFELAEYHWDKVKATIVNGYLKRPGRKANADAFFVNGIWEEVNEAFKSKDAAKAWAAFQHTRETCMACHEAEKVGFVNNQELFISTEKAPGM